MAIWKRLKKYRDMDLEAEEKKLADADLEKSDFLAMLLAAVVTLVLPALLILVLLALVVMALFGLFL